MSMDFFPVYNNNSFRISKSDIDKDNRVSNDFIVLADISSAIFSNLFFQKKNKKKNAKKLRESNKPINIP